MSEFVSQTRANFAAQGRYPPIDSSSIRLELIDVIGTFELWRGVVQLANHIPPILLAYNGSETFPLGGFSETRLMILDSMILADPNEDHEPVTRAMVYARWLDLNGADSVMFPLQTANRQNLPVELADWAERYSETWTRDTVMVDGGGSIVVLTALSLDKMHDPVWVPMIYSFNFDKSNRLISWARNLQDEVTPAQR
jgi:hypothetical protein